MDAAALLGVVALVVGAGLAVTGLPRLAWRSRLRRTKITPIARASEGSVAIRGRVVPSHEGFVTSPIFERRAVWFRLSLDEEFAAGLGSDDSRRSWHQTIDRVVSRAFFLDDGSGAQARIEPAEAQIYYGSIRSGTFSRGHSGLRDRVHG